MQKETIVLMVALMAIPPLAMATGDQHSVTTNLSGTFNNPQENGCIHVSLFFNRVDCSYSHRRPELNGKPIPWVGPVVDPVYYPRESPHASPSHVPAADDERLAPPLVAAFTVHTQGTATGSDDTLSGVFTVGPATRSISTRTDTRPNIIRAVESWLRIQHTLAETPVTTAARNDAGGLDYVIASKGFPTRLCLKKAPEDCFPSAGAAYTADGKWGADTWLAPATVEMAASPALGGNVGASTTAVIEGYSCADTAIGEGCAHGAGLWGGVGHAGLDNVLLTVSTDAQGRIRSVRGFWTSEYRIDFGPPALQAPDGQANSWFGGYLELRAGDPAETP